MKKYFAALLLLAVAWPSFAADLNGYTALYECRAGGPYCNVDVVSLTAAACAQTITTADNASAINTKLNTGSSPICVSPGDYTATGVWTLTTSGSSGAYRVLRYYRSGDSDDDPWNQSDANKAKILGIDDSAGQSYWIIHRLDFPSVDQNVGQRIYFNSTASNMIVSRILVEGMQAGYSSSNYGANYGVSVGNGANITLQNSVIRNSWGHAGYEPMGFSVDNGTNIHVVNNEFYDWSAHPVQLGQNNSPKISYVFENNDDYQTSAFYTNGGLNSRGKSTLSIKSSGYSSTNYNQIIHNRIWGVRHSDTTVCCLYGDGPNVMYFSTNTTPGSNPTDYTLVQNNIFFDSQDGFSAYNGPANFDSIIGNIFYLINNATPGWSALTIDDGGWMNDYEVYLNTIIDAPQNTISATPTDGPFDWRCNVLLSSGTEFGTTPASSSPGAQADNNVFYDTKPFSFNGTNANITNAVVTRANSTAYSLNNIMRTGAVSGCITGTESACFLYMATVAGTSAGSPTTACTTPGCTYTDGGVKWTAVRGPYTFYRKLRTSPEPYVIPYARAYDSAPEVNSCPSSYASRTGIGIN